MEWGGLPAALERLFPDHEFYAIPSPAEIQSNPDRFPYDSFTSVTLTSKHEEDPPEATRELVRRAAQEALGDRRRDAADIVVVLDDLELANADQPDRVTRVFRGAVKLHLAELSRQGRFYTRTEQVLKERVSFHLIVPMIESWLFADQSALTVAGVPSELPVFAEPDLERFLTNHPAYLDATERDCPCWTLKRSKKYRPKWLGALTRERHPKGYVQWLCRDGAAKNCTRYSEGTSGSEALSGLRWEDVLARPGSPWRYLRALLADLSDAVGESPTIRVDEAPDPPIPATSLVARPADHVLRNL
jgi:hypothetical protein